jgi:hypothetical protein
MATLKKFPGRKKRLQTKPDSSTTAADAPTGRVPDMPIIAEREQREDTPEVEAPNGRSRGRGRAPNLIEGGQDEEIEAEAANPDRRR